MKYEIKKRVIQTTKTAIGAGCSIAIANSFGLSFGTAAGIITLLSILDTKKDTLKTAVNRVEAFVISLVISYVFFQILGFTAIAFACYLFTFIILCSIFHLESGIPMNAVLMSHFLAFGKMGTGEILNEMWLLFIGAGIGTLLNLYMPDNQYQIREDQRKIEQMFRTIFSELADGLTNENMRNKSSDSFRELKAYMKKSSRRSYENSNNSLFSESEYFTKYMELRRNQYEVLEQIFRIMKRLDGVPNQAMELAKFVEMIAEALHETNKCEILLKECTKLKSYYQSTELPKNRLEFENRAVLYLMLLEIERFLLIKSEFVEELTENEIKKYWTFE